MSLSKEEKLLLLTTAYYEEDDIVWTVIDIIGDFRNWPDFVQKVVLSDTFQYRERCVLCSFFYVNGVRDPDYIRRFLMAMKGPHMNAYERTISDLIKYMNSEGDADNRYTIKSRYFSKCMMHGIYEDLNGNPRPTTT